jgi:hypothetical protein
MNAQHKQSRKSRKMNCHARERGDGDQGLEAGTENPPRSKPARLSLPVKTPSVPPRTDLRAAQVGEGIREFTTLDRNPLLERLNLWSCIPRQAPIPLELIDGETPVLGQKPVDWETL